MSNFYVFHFKDYPEYLKIGFSTKIEDRVEALKNWGDILDDSIYFSLPNKELAVEIEGCLKRIFKHNCSTIAKKLPSRAGRTEFVSVEYYDYICNFVKTYIGLPTGTQIEVQKVSTIKAPSDVESPAKEEVITLTLVKIGAKLKSLRLAKNLNRQKLAEIAGVSMEVIESAEKGKCKLQTLVILLQVLGYSDWIATFPMDVEGALMCNPYNKKVA
jgi:DNA-binding XRE family transcriptional regulator